MDLWRLFDRKLVFVRSPEEESRFCVAICFYLRQENQAARIRELHERDGKRMGLLRRIETPTIRVWECVIGRSTEDPKGATERVERHSSILHLHAVLPGHDDNRYLGATRKEFNELEDTQNER